MGGGDTRGQVSAAAPTRDGWLYVSGALTPYDLENLCDQIATLGRQNSGDVHVEVELGGLLKDSPELQTLARRMKRLRRQGVVVHVHAARDRSPTGGSLTN
jgi:wyosine [tRNA(Phe)-imidazoG37] synthetase (radical SAM superfamily)